MPAVARPQPHQVLVHRRRLVPAAPSLQQMRQVVRRLGPQGAGGAVVADRLLRPRRTHRLQPVRQAVAEPDVAGLVRLCAAEQVDGRVALVGGVQGLGQQDQARRRPALRIGLLRQLEQGPRLRLAVGPSPEVAQSIASLVGVGGASGGDQPAPCRLVPGPGRAAVGSPSRPAPRPWPSPRPTAWPGSAPRRPPGPGHRRPGRRRGRPAA